MRVSQRSRETDVISRASIRLETAPGMESGRAVSPTTGDTRHAIDRLLAYCGRNQWAGFDPYDCLNSRLIQQTPLRGSKWFRIVLTQVMKRLPVNLRPLFLVPPERNPKAIALFLKSIGKLMTVGMVTGDGLAGEMMKYLVELRAESSPYWCWGYCFPWQTRTELVPKGSPNLVCTCFVADALLDHYERTRDAAALEMALSAAEFLVNELYWSESGGEAGFSYPFPGARSRVHNANYLGAALLCRSFKHTGEKKFLDPALAVARYSSSMQHGDGSWDYGESPTQRWVDNFHTGYNLCALRSIGEDVATDEFQETIRKGLAFYRDRFFMDDGAPKYFHDRAYPIDIHSVAQSMITLLVFKNDCPDGDAVAHAVHRWAMEHMWDERGYFYYQVRPYFTNRISYMRWSQAWMLLALATLLESDLRG